VRGSFESGCVRISNLEQVSVFDEISPLANSFLPYARCTNTYKAPRILVSRRRALSHKWKGIFRRKIYQNYKKAFEIWRTLFFFLTLNVDDDTPRDHIPHDHATHVSFVLGCACLRTVSDLRRYLCVFAIQFPSIFE